LLLIVFYDLIEIGNPNSKP